MNTTSDIGGALAVYLIIYTVIAFFPSLGVGWAAEQRGRSGLVWFVISYMLSPVMAVLILIAAGDSAKKRKKITEEAQIAAIPMPNKPITPSRPLGTNSDPLGLAKKAFSKTATEETTRLEQPTWIVQTSTGEQQEMTEPQIKAAIKGAALSPENLYWDPAADQWLELSAHPQIG
jgi:hypothetical protein